MLADGAHIQIGSFKFRLAFGAEDAYAYSLVPKGEEVTFWLWDDWSGGEGNDSYDSQDPVVYDQGNVNPRMPGELTTPPVRTIMTTGALSPVPATALSAIAGGRLFVMGENVTAGAHGVSWTTDLVNWKRSTLAWNAAVDRVAAMVTDGINVYLCGQDDATGSYQLRQFKAVGATDAGSANETAVETYATTTNTLPILGMAKVGKFLYIWNGQKMYYRNVDTAAAGDVDITLKNLNSDFSGLTLNTSYWGGCIVGEGSVFAFVSTEGSTKVYEVDKQQGGLVEIWSLPNGFTGKTICYQQGSLVIAGEYQNNAAVYGMSILSRQPIFLGFIRLGTDISLEVSGAGFGSEIILGERDATSTGGKLFIYDIGQDAFSQLDTLSHASGECWSVGTFLDKRFAAVEDGNDLNLYLWDFDDNPSTTVDGRMESGVWDFDLPEEEKQLDGFHVLSNAGGGKSVDVYYQDNEDGTWTLAGNVASGFHGYIPVTTAGNAITFRALRMRVDPKGGAKVFSVSARVRVNTYEETWIMRLDLTDEAVDASTGSRRREYSDRGWQLRDAVRGFADDKTVLTLLDGAKYPQGQGADPDKYTTHTVITDILEDRLEQPGEGTMLVRMRSISVN